MREYHQSDYLLALGEVRKLLDERLFADQLSWEAIWIRMCLSWPTDFVIGAVRMEGKRIQKVTTNA